MKSNFKWLTTVLLTILMAFVLLGCGDTSETEQAEKSAELIDVEITMDNFSDYIDFAETSDGKWVAINKKYDEGMVVWSDSDLDIATGAKFDEDGDHVMWSSIFSHAFSEKPEITDVRGGITFAKSGKSYINDEGWLVTECGSKSQSREITNDEQMEYYDRANYLDEYPY